MSYYTGQGDYYSGKGDPGLISSIGSIVGAVGSVIGGPAGVVGSVIKRVTGGSRPAAPPVRGLARPTGGIPSIPTPGIVGAAQRLVPGGASGYQSGGCGCGTGHHMDKATGTRCVKNRKTNYTNPKALSRATKRVDGFVTVAKKALKSTKYKVVNENFKQNWRKPLKK